MMKKKFSFFNYWCLFSFLLSFCLVFNWTKAGFIVGTAEEGITYYNIERTVNTVSNIWTNGGLGNASPFFVPRVPYYFFISLFESLGVPNWAIQSSTFFLLLFLPLIYIPKLIEMFDFEKCKTGYLVAIFYLFNLYTMTQIFNRFIILFIFVWSLLPIFLFYWIKWVSQGNVKNLIYFQVFSLLYSYVYGLPSSVFVLWLPSLLFVVYIFVQKKDKQIIRRSISGLLLWILCSLWWIYPVLSLRNNGHTTMIDSGANFNSLVEVSNYYDNGNVLSLTQKYYFDREGFFKTFYSQNIVNISSKIITLFLMIGVIIALFRKKYTYFILILLVGWFISKGTNPPFGYEFYNFMFKNFSFFQVLRNPYEKFGVVFLLAYSVLVSYGIYSVFTYIFKKKVGSLITCLFVCILCLVIGRPIFTGDIFYGYYYIKVPEYYETANLKIKNLGYGKILHLPFRSIANIKYIWNFQGEDISTHLFDNPSISGVNSTKDEYDFFSKMPMYFSNPNFSNLLNVLNVNFVVVHRDYIQDLSYYGDPSSTINDLKGWKNLSFLSDEDGLVVYKLDDFEELGEINLFENVKNVRSLDDAFSDIVSENFNPRNDVVYVEDQNSNTAYTFNTYIKKPKYEVVKLNNRKYKVKIINAKNPYILVLDNSFNKRWIASSGEQVFDKKFVANGYANGWLVDKMGDYSIDIVFIVWPWD